MKKQQNTQQPVAWTNSWVDAGDQRHYEIEWLCDPVAGELLYTAPPVPRDVLMAALGELDDWIVDESGLGIPYRVREEIADRYASKVQPEHVPLTAAGSEDQAVYASIAANYHQPEPVNQQTLAALNRLADASRPVATALYNIGQQHEDWSSLRPLIAELDSARSHGYAAIAAAEAAQPVGATPKPFGFISPQAVADLKAGKNVPATISHYRFNHWQIPIYTEHPASDQPVAVPDGYALVPVEPTPKMLEAMVEAAECDFPYCEAISSYYAMLSAAQKEKGNNY